MCIYYGNRMDLTYFEEEHVFPAGLGGISKLQRGTVSDQANKLFSKMELELMHHSLLSTTRALLGPGKRGSHSPAKMSKSEIGLLCKDGTKLALGYISGKKGYYIDSLTKQGTEDICCKGQYRNCPHYNMAAGHLW